MQWKICILTIFEAVGLTALALMVLLLSRGVGRAGVPLSMGHRVELDSFRHSVRGEKIFELAAIRGQVSVSQWRIFPPNCIIHRVEVVLLVDH